MSRSPACSSRWCTPSAPGEPARPSRPAGRRPSSWRWPGWLVGAARPVRSTSRRAAAVTGDRRRPGHRDHPADPGRASPTSHRRTRAPRRAWSTSPTNSAAHSASPSSPSCTPGAGTGHQDPAQLGRLPRRLHRRGRLLPDRPGPLRRRGRRGPPRQPARRPPHHLNALAAPQVRRRLRACGAAGVRAARLPGYGARGLRGSWATGLVGYGARGLPLELMPQTNQTECLPLPPASVRLETLSPPAQSPSAQALQPEALQPEVLTRGCRLVGDVTNDSAPKEPTNTSSPLRRGGGSRSRRRTPSMRRRRDCRTVSAASARTRGRGGTADDREVTAVPSTTWPGADRTTEWRAVSSPVRLSRRPDGGGGTRGGASRSRTPPSPPRRARRCRRRRGAAGR